MSYNRTPLEDSEFLIFYTETRGMYIGTGRNKKWIPTDVAVNKTMKVVSNTTYNARTIATKEINKSKLFNSRVKIFKTVQVPKKAS